MKYFEVLHYFVADSKPSTKQLLPFLAQLAPNWYELGATLLDVEQESQLRVIQTNYNDVTKCCLAMLQHWMETHPKATWNQLVAALRSPGVNLDVVASEIEKHFIGELCDY